MRRQRRLPLRRQAVGCCDGRQRWAAATPPGFVCRALSLEPRRRRLLRCGGSAATSRHHHTDYKAVDPARRQAGFHAPLKSKRLV